MLLFDNKSQVCACPECCQPVFVSADVWSIGSRAHRLTFGRAVIPLAEARRLLRA